MKQILDSLNTEIQNNNQTIARLREEISVLHKAKNLKSSQIRSVTKLPNAKNYIRVLNMHLKTSSLQMFLIHTVNCHALTLQIWILYPLLFI